MEFTKAEERAFLRAQELDVEGLGVENWLIQMRESISLEDLSRKLKVSVYTISRLLKKLGISSSTRKQRFLGKGTYMLVKPRKESEVHQLLKKARRGSKRARRQLFRQYGIRYFKGRDFEKLPDSYLNQRILQ